MLDIANELNISPGTVSKALNGKNGVSKKMRERVLDAAKRSGYSINVIAQGLSRKPTKIAVIIHGVWKEFYGPIQNGIEMELRSLIDQKFSGNFITMPALRDAAEVFEETLDGFIHGGERPDAIIICPYVEGKYVGRLDALHEKGVKIVLVGLAHQRDKCFSRIRIASEMSGKMAAEYAGLFCGQKFSCAVFIGNKDVEDHRRKAENFQQAAAESNLSVTGVYETQDDVDIAYLLTKKVIQSNPDLGMIYVATSNSVAVCKCILDLQLSDRIKIIATDIFPDMGRYVEKGLILATIYQNTLKMGRMAVKLIYDSVTKGEPMDEETLIFPHLVLRSNYSVYSGYLKKAEEKTVSDFYDKNETV